MTPRPDDPLVPCRDCGQHHRAGDTTCPHCGSPVPPPPAPPGEKRVETLGRVMYGPPPYITQAPPPPYRTPVLVVVTVAAVLGFLLLVWKLLA